MSSTVGVGIQVFSLHGEDNVGGWELKFAPPRQVGQLPAVIHALPRP